MIVHYFIVVHAKAFCLCTYILTTYYLQSGPSKVSYLAPFALDVYALTFVFRLCLHPGYRGVTNAAYMPKPDKTPNAAKAFYFAKSR